MPFKFTMIVITIRELHPRHCSLYLMSYIFLNRFYNTTLLKKNFVLNTFSLVMRSLSVVALLGHWSDIVSLCLSGPLNRALGVTLR